MNQNEPPHRTSRGPSLLVDPARAPALVPESGPHTTGRDEGGVANAGHAAPSHHRRVWWLLLLLVAVVLLAWYYRGWNGRSDTVVAPARTPLVAGAAGARIDGSVPTPASAAGLTAHDETQSGHAIIMSEPAGVASARMAVAGASEAASGHAAATPSSEHTRDHLAAIVGGGAATRKPVVHHRRRVHRGTDSDVRLLTALLEHVEDDGPNKKVVAVDPAQVATRRCAPANTRAGARCRMRICKKYVGRSPMCPEPTPAADDN